MRRHISLRIGALVSLGFLAGGSLCAQSGPAAAQTADQTSTSPATSSTPAQTPSHLTATETNSGASAGAESSKKVWTNEDMGALRDDPSIPASRPTKAKAQTNGPKLAKPQGRNAAWYRNQIAGLEAQVPPLNEQIAALQSAIDGKPTGDQQTSKRPLGVKIDSWSEQRDELMQKRDGTLARIDSLRDEARHNGIAASALP